MKSIYITGVARSGTTVLARMFHSFKDVEIINDECNIYDFVKYIKTNVNNSNVIVGKRTEHTIFSNTLSQTEIERQLKIIKKNNIIIINCVRDGRNVVDSWLKAWKIYNPFAWMSGIKQSLEYHKNICLQVKYECLIKKPNIVQNEIISKFDLKKKSLFSKYPRFVPYDCFKTEQKEYKLRPLKKEQQKTTSYLSEPNDVRYFLTLNLKLGYD